MYGVVDHAGSFTGDNIVFVYPDFLTGLQGTFLDGVLVKGRAVDIIGERCNNGIKELKLRSSRHDSHIEWYLEVNAMFFSFDEIKHIGFCSLTMNNSLYLMLLVNIQQSLSLLKGNQSTLTSLQLRVLMKAYLPRDTSDLGTWCPISQDRGLCKI